MAQDLIHIKELVESHFGFKIDTRRRFRPLVEARYIYAHLSRKYTNHSLTLVGKIIDRDHASIIHYLKHFEFLVMQDKNFQDNSLILESEFFNPSMKNNPYEKYLSKEDRLQNAVMRYMAAQYPDILCIHVPNEGRRSPFERFKFKYLGGVSGVPDVLIFHQNANKCGLAIELKVGYNKPTENQKNVLERLKNANWAACWVNTLDDAVKTINEYINEAHTQKDGVLE